MGRVNGRSPTHPTNQPPVTLVNTIISGVVAGVSEVVKHAVTRLEGAIATQESVTLKPGDTLIVRISPDRWSSEQAREYEEHLNARLGVPVKLVAGDGLYACLNGRIYGPCGHSNCYGACDDTHGVCKSLPGCCDDEDEG